VALIMGIGSLLAGGVLLFLKMGGDQPKLNSAKA
jgi:hypothetical protein